MSDILFLATGLVIGALSAWLITKFYYQKNVGISGTEVEKLQLNEKLAAEKNRALEQEVLNQKEELTLEREKVVSLTSRLASKEADHKNLELKLEEHKKEIEQIREKFTIEFKHLANEIFEEKSKKFTDQNKSNITDILKPLREKITEFERKVDETHKENIKGNAQLKEQIVGLKELNQQITKEAENLTKALKGESKTQGNWGEFILESILEKSGLQKDREYFLQESMTSEEGRRYQPDVIIKLPDQKNIIIDSKVSLIAYERYVNEEDNRESSLKMHIQSIRKHIKDLSEKSYQNLSEVEGLDFVLMFIPVEPAFSLAVQNDTELFSDAYDKNIVIVSPSTLIATLRTIANIWKNEYQNRNAFEIARQGGDLYDKFVSFTEDLKNVGRHIDSTQKTYVEAMKKLVDGKGNLINRARKIKDLGAKTSKQLDQKLIDRADLD